MSAFHARRNEDVAKLRDLERRSRGRIRVAQVSGEPVSAIRLRLAVRTAADAKFPARALQEVNATIELGARYPFEPPAVLLTTAVFNPNVFTSGRVCLGPKPSPTEFLDLLAVRLFKILSFDESIVNVESPANVEAARWYVRAKVQHPAAFPSDTLGDWGTKPESAIKWTDKSQSAAPPDKPPGVVIVTCPACKAKLRLPAGRSGRVSCPTCKHAFQVQT